MLSTTDAIVLALQPYSDKAHILHAYTRAYGRVNYKVYGLGRKHAIGMYAPLSLIQITASYPASGLPTLREAVQQTKAVLQSEGRSCSEAVLQSEGRSCSEAVLQRCSLYKQTISLFISEVLYHVLRHPMPDEPMFEFLAQAIQELNATNEPQNFHIQFLIGLATMLGFGIEQEPPLPATRTERQKTLRTLCAYYEEHVETWQEPKSLDILMEVFD